MDKVGEEFIEMTFMPLDDVWERELGNLFDDEWLCKFVKQLDSYGKVW